MNTASALDPASTTLRVPPVRLQNGVPPSRGIRAPSHRHNGIRTYDITARVNRISYRVDDGTWFPSRSIFSVDIHRGLAPAWPFVSHNLRAARCASKLAASSPLLSPPEHAGCKSRLHEQGRWFRKNDSCSSIIASFFHPRPPARH